MNQTFHIQRWLLLVGKHWSDNQKRFLFGLLGIMGLLLLWHIFVFMAGDQRAMNPEVQAATYYGGLGIIGFIFASMQFSDLASTPRGIEYLSVPASLVEKLLCHVFFSLVVFTLCYTVLFYLVDFGMIKIENSVALHNWVGSGKAEAAFNPREVVNVFRDPNRQRYGDNTKPDQFMIFFWIYISLQAAFMLGSVYFKRYSFIKTVIAVSLLAIIYTFFIGKIISPLLPPGGFSSMGLSRYRVYEPYVYPAVRKEAILQLPSWIDTVLGFLVKFAWAPCFWVITYFRLKEKQV